MRARARPADVVVFGEAIWDLFPRRPGESLAHRTLDVRHPGGAPANVARTLARLGVRVNIVTAVGDDPLGEGLIDELAEAGVGVADVVRLSARTGVTFVDVAKDGARRFLFYRHPSADMLLAPEMLTRETFAASWLHVGSSTLARAPSRFATLAAIAHARAAGASISQDVNARRHLWSSPDELRTLILPITLEADFVKASEEDLELLGFTPDEAGARELHERRGGRATILTLADRGAVGFLGPTVIHVTTSHPRVVDVTGAGDAFMAGALSTWIRAKKRDVATLDGALRLGCRLGTRVVTRLGATAALHTMTRETSSSSSSSKKTTKPKKASSR